MKSAAVLALLGALLLGCAGVGGNACCSVDDVVLLHTNGADDALIIDAIRTSGTHLQLSATDLLTLSSAGVSREVIDVLHGGPCVCNGAAPAPAPARFEDHRQVAATEPVPTPEFVDELEEEEDGPPRPGDEVPLVEVDGVELEIQYAGGKSFKLLNPTTTTYTDVVLVMNGTYKYSLGDLEPGQRKFVRINKFADPQTAQSPGDALLDTLTAECAQGHWEAKLWDEPPPPPQ